MFKGVLGFRWQTNNGNLAYWRRMFRNLHARRWRFRFYGPQWSCTHLLRFLAHRQSWCERTQLLGLDADKTLVVRRVNGNCTVFVVGLTPITLQKGLQQQQTLAKLAAYLSTTPRLLHFKPHPSNHFVLQQSLPF